MKVVIGNYLDGQMSRMQKVADPLVIIEISFRLSEFVVVVREF